MLKKRLFSSDGIWNAGAVILRIIAGFTIFKFGLEIFSEDKMNGFSDWLTDLNFPVPVTMAYVGKVCELAGGSLLALGLFTRVATIALTITMFVIAIIMSKAGILDADGSFLLMLIYLHFLLTGPGKLSLDYLLFRQKKNAE